MGTPGGRYELVRLLGRGGSGEVWEAVLHGPHGFRKPVAVKLLASGRSGEAAERALLDEARLGALLHHPNVVSTLAVGAIEGRACIVMELVVGAPASAFVREDGLPAGVVVELGVQVCAGLQHVHGLRIEGRPTGLVHRDLKPGNLLVDRTGLVKIADLGIAAIRGEPGRPAGTPGFAAPEQVEGEAGAAADLWSLGATLYTLLRGRPPFGRGPAAFANAVRADELLPGLLARVEPGLASVLARCLRHDPAERWSDAAELGAALAAIHPTGPTLLEVLASVRPDLAVETPPSTGRRSTDATVSLPRGNLPPARDAFVGRRAEVGELGQRLRRPGLVTLLGMGGAGKTRLALEVARELRSELHGGAWFFDLSDARSVEGLCFAVASALGRELAPADPADQVGHALAARGRALFVLDNLEQAVEHAAATVGRWGGLAPEAAFLCTSRLPLRLRAEERVPVGALPLEDGAALFVERAGGEPDPDDVRAIVDAVGGLPLALELAAARARLLPVREVRRRLSDALRLLAGGDRDRPARQQSLRASLDGSWDLLSASAQAALATLTVFEGGYLLEAAEAVLELQRFPQVAWAMDVLQELVEASLLAVDPATGRFTFRSVVHAWARERLPDADRRRAEVRHGAHYAQFGTEAARGALYTHGGAARMAALVLELDNLIAASRRAVDRGDGDIAAAAALAASEVLRFRGPVTVAPTLLEPALAVAPAAWRIPVALELGWSLRNCSDPRAAPALERALAEARRLGRRGEEGQALRLLAGLAYDAGRPDEALAQLDRATELVREAGDRRTEAQALSNLGLLLELRGRHAEARDRYVEALRIQRRIGDRWSEGVTLSNLAAAEQAAGRLDDALAVHGEALALSRQLGHTRSTALLLSNLAHLHLDRGRPDDARPCAEEAVALTRSLGDRRLEGRALAALAGVEAELGRVEAAVASYEEALAIARAIGDPNAAAVLGNLAELHVRLGHIGSARDRLAEALGLARVHGDAVQERVWAGNLGRIEVLLGIEGGEARLDAAVSSLRALGEGLDLARVLGLRAETDLDRGDRAAADRVLAEVARIADTAGVGPGSDVRALLERLRAR